MGKLFTQADVVNGRIFADGADLIEAPMWWHLRGLTQTATGYGRKLNTGRKINFNGRAYRLYATCFSNNASVWFTVRGVKISVS